MKTIEKQQTEKQTDMLRKDKDIYDPTKPYNDQVRELIVSTHPTSFANSPIIVIPSGKRFMIDRDANYWGTLLRNALH